MTNFLSGKKKILTMILGFISGLAMVFGLDQTEVNVISGAIVSMGSVIGYLIVEGKIDVERIRNAAVAVNDALAFYREPEGDETEMENKDADEDIDGDTQ